MRGGGIIMIEPYYGPLARFLFKRLHSSEGYETNVPTWESEANMGAMSNANQALSYVVFAKDREIFEQEFPELELLVDRPHTHLRYLLSGGVNFRQLVPKALGSFVAAGGKPSQSLKSVPRSSTHDRSAESPGARAVFLA